MTQDIQIKRDRMRFTNDKFSSNLVLFAIVLDALYFVSIYQSDVGSFYYKWIIGVSIVYNLIFMMAAFLCSVGVKSRKTGYTPVLILLGAVQIARIFILPKQAHEAIAIVNGEEIAVMSNGQYTYLIVCLVASAACLLIAAVVSFINNRNLAAYMRTIKE